ncbi:unnamed protein product [Brugia pahangi]|uniref:Uncharacterized protein n=1 Tax=Brugia pahangi TaxID=6280 RepID=A0A0N4TBK9_BRUPA|nr:unnamed protein product [Brugia pahangi]
MNEWKRCDRRDHHGDKNTFFILLSSSVSICQNVLGGGERGIANIAITALNSSNKTVIIGHNCSRNEFKCSIDNKCIPLLKVQDGTMDCIDGSDEGIHIISSLSLSLSLLFYFFYIIILFSFFVSFSSKLYL